MKKKEYSQLYRIINKEKVNLYQKNKRLVKYQNDPEYRTKVLEQQKICKNKKKIKMGLIIDPLKIMKRGRPSSFALNENLELYKLID
jgi:hypothetical protein